MAELITSQFYDKFMSLCAEARESLKLCAPYVKADIVADIIAHRRNGVPLSLVTKINLKDFHGKASDTDALKLILRSGGFIRNCSNLHAKLYIFDDKKCLVASANLTASGFKRNVETGIFSADVELANAASTFYNGIMAQKHNDVGRITERTIDEIDVLLAKIPSTARIEYPKLKFGDAAAFVPSTEADENLLAVANGLSGWRRDVFLALGSVGEIFDSADVTMIARLLSEKYANNNNREAKIRQILQQLRDLGLVEFVSPGIYKKLWI